MSTDQPSTHDPVPGQTDITDVDVQALADVQSVDPLEPLGGQDDPTDTADDDPADDDPADDDPAVLVPDAGSDSDDVDDLDEG